MKFSITLLYYHNHVFPCFSLYNLKFGLQAYLIKIIGGSFISNFFRLVFKWKKRANEYLI